MMNTYMYVQERKSFRLYVYWYVSGVVVSFLLLPKKKQTQVGMCVCLWWKKIKPTNDNTTSSCRSQQPTDCGTRHAEPNPGSGRSFFFLSHCWAERNVKLEYFGRLFKKSGPNECCHTHTNKHTRNSGCISHHTPTKFVVLLRYCMKVNTNGRAFDEIKYSMGPTPRKTFSFCIYLSLCGSVVHYLRMGIFLRAAMLPNRMISGEAGWRNRFKQLISNGRSKRQSNSSCWNTFVSCEGDGLNPKRVSRAHIALGGWKP